MKGCLSTTVRREPVWWCDFHACVRYICDREDAVIEAITEEIEAVRAWAPLYDGSTILAMLEQRLKIRQRAAATEAVADSAPRPREEDAEGAATSEED